MIQIIPFIAMLFILPLVSEGQSQTWFACKTSSECVLVKDYCMWRAVNKKFVKDFAESNHPSPYECVVQEPDKDTMKNFKAVCKNSMCESEQR